MIKRSAILNFFDDENQARKEQMNQLYSMELEERIKKRKAIDNVTFDPNYKDFKLGYQIRKAYAPVNISDFKVGEYLAIHRSTPYFPDGGCNLFDILDDGALLLGFDGFGNVYNIDNIVAENNNERFILDKSSIDMSRIYSTGLAAIKKEHIDLINDIPTPQFSDDMDSLIEEIKDTEKNFGLNLTNNQREAIAKAMAAEDYYLIQGPPGTGKTFVIALLLIELMVYKKERVAVSGPNHLAINNVLSKLCSTHNGLQGVTLKIGQEFNTLGLEYYDCNNEPRAVHNLERLTDISSINNWQHDEVGIVVGCTPFHMHTSRAGGLKVDTLIIDEAGQMNIGLALMAMSCAKRVIFVGDHKQMSPIFSSDKHSEELNKSIFEHLYRDYNCTTLDTTFRMNAPICNLISECFYNGVLQSAVPDKRLKISAKNEDVFVDSEHPIVMKNIVHGGTNSSEEEADFCVSTIIKFINEQKCNASDIAVIAPFRAQCALIRRKLKAQKDIIPEYKSIVVETVDRMQGQESEIIFISLTAGDMEYMSELTNFIFNPNRFNVAISRAKNKLIIVGNFNNIETSMNDVECSWLRQLLQSKDIIKV